MLNLSRCGSRDSFPLDLCLRFRQALHSALPKRPSAVCPTSNGPLIGLP
jgi:hypothetical protein